MSGVYENTEYDLISAPMGGYKPMIVSPKVRFQATAGYVHQRDRYPARGKKIVIESPNMSQGEYNMQRAWIDYIGSETFWYVLPTSLEPRPDGQVIPRAILARIIDEEIPEDPVEYGDGYIYHTRITLESIGPEVE
jgi:hypothetical protein